MRAYSMDLRERVLADCDAGLGTRAVAAKSSPIPAVRNQAEAVRRFSRQSSRPKNTDQNRGRVRRSNRAAQ